MYLKVQWANIDTEIYTSAFVESISDITADVYNIIWFGFDSYVWGVDLVFISYLWISIIHLWISITHLWIPKIIYGYP